MDRRPGVAHTVSVFLAAATEYSETQPGSASSVQDGCGAEPQQRAGRRTSGTTCDITVESPAEVQLLSGVAAEDLARGGSRSATMMDPMLLKPLLCVDGIAAALAQWWEFLPKSCFNSVTYATYRASHQLLCRVMAESQWDPSWVDVEADWLLDSRGEPALTRSLFDDMLLSVTAVALRSRGEKLRTDAIIAFLASTLEQVVHLESQCGLLAPEDDPLDTLSASWRPAGHAGADKAQDGSHRSDESSRHCLYCEEGDEEDAAAAKMEDVAEEEEELGGQEDMQAASSSMTDMQTDLQDEDSSQCDSEASPSKKRGWSARCEGKTSPPGSFRKRRQQGRAGSRFGLTRKLGSLRSGLIQPLVLGERGGHMRVERPSDLCQGAPLPHGRATWLLRQPSGRPAHVRLQSGRAAANLSADPLLEPKSAACPGVMDQAPRKPPTEADRRALGCPPVLGLEVPEGGTQRPREPQLPPVNNRDIEKAAERAPRSVFGAAHAVGLRAPQACVLRVGAVPVAPAEVQTTPVAGPLADLEALRVTAAEFLAVLSAKMKEQTASESCGQAEAAPPGLLRLGSTVPPPAFFPMSVERSPPLIVAGKVSAAGDRHGLDGKGERSAAGSDGVPQTGCTPHPAPSAFGRSAALPQLSTGASARSSADGAAWSPGQFVGRINRPARMTQRAAMCGANSAGADREVMTGQRPCDEDESMLKQEPLKLPVVVASKSYGKRFQLQGGLSSPNFDDSADDRRLHSLHSGRATVAKSLDSGLLALPAAARQAKTARGKPAGRSMSSRPAAGRHVPAADPRRDAGEEAPVFSKFEPYNRDRVFKLIEKYQYEQGGVRRPKPGLNRRFPC